MEGWLWNVHVGQVVVESPVDSTSGVMPGDGVPDALDRVAKPDEGREAEMGRVSRECEPWSSDSASRGTPQSPHIRPAAGLRPGGFR